MKFAFAVADRQGTVAHHVARQHRFPFAQHRGGDEIRHALVIQIGIGARGDYFQIGGRRFDFHESRQQQHRAGIDMGAFK